MACLHIYVAHEYFPTKGTTYCRNTAQRLALSSDRLASIRFDFDKIPFQATSADKKNFFSQFAIGANNPNKPNIPNEKDKSSCQTKSIAKR